MTLRRGRTADSAVKVHVSGRLSWPYENGNPPAVFDVQDAFVSVTVQRRS